MPESRANVSAFCRARVNASVVAFCICSSLKREMNRNSGLSSSGSASCNSDRKVPNCSALLAHRGFVSGTVGSAVSALVSKRRRWKKIWVCSALRALMSQSADNYYLNCANVFLYFGPFSGRGSHYLFVGVLFCMTDEERFAKLGSHDPKFIQPFRSRFALFVQIGQSQFQCRLVRSQSNNHHQ